MTEILQNFSAVLSAAEEGQLQTDLSDELRNIVAELHNLAVSNGGKPKGELTLKLTLQLDGGSFNVDATIATKLPKRQRIRSVMWATPDNNLTRANPRQQRLPLADVSHKREVV